MKSPLFVGVLLCSASFAEASEVFSYPPSPSGGLVASAWVDPDGSDSDIFAWNDFTLPATESITEVRWRGGYAYGALYGKAFDFSISFHATNITGFEPLVLDWPDPYGEPCLAQYIVGSNAGETPVGVVNGITMYDYRFVLPKPFVALAGVKYWIRIDAWQKVFPDWGVSKGTGGNGSHFRVVNHVFQNAPGDTSFTLLAAWKDLGFAKPGTAGLPSLVGSGSLASNQAGKLELTQAKSNALTFGIAGLSALNAPFYGGVLVPTPDILFTAATNGSGKLTIPFMLPPNTPSGVTIYLQFWITDPGATLGYAASNALRGVTG